MNVIVLNKENYTKLNKRTLANNWNFQPFLDDWGNILITEKELSMVEGSEFNWLKELPVVSRASLREDLLNEEEYLAKEKAAAQARVQELDSKLKLKTKTKG